jgi:nucleoside-diphosphate-sugar epimerase
MGCKYYQLDVTDGKKYREIVENEKVTYIVHLAAILSSLGERNFDLAYNVNIHGSKNALDIAKDNDCAVYIPSTIGVFGGT